MSSRFRARAVLIDLDGTLVDSLPDIACAANSMRAELGLSPLPLERIAAYVGKGVDVLVHRALTETMDDQAPPELFRTRQASRSSGVMARSTATSRSVYPGVQQALEELRSKAILLACVTNKPRSFTLQLLERTNLKAAFAAIVSGDDTRTKEAARCADAACMPTPWRRGRRRDRHRRFGERRACRRAPRAAG